MCYTTVGQTSDKRAASFVTMKCKCPFVVAAARKYVAVNVNRVGGETGTSGNGHPGRGNRAASDIQAVRMLCK